MKNKKQDKALSEADIHEIIQMAWCDKTSFEMIKHYSGLTHNHIKAIMKKNLKRSSYKLWRKRVTYNKRKNYKKNFSTTSPSSIEPPL